MTLYPPQGLLRALCAAALASHELAALAAAPPPPTLADCDAGWQQVLRAAPAPMAAIDARAVWLGGATCAGRRPTRRHGFGCTTQATAASPPCPARR